MKQLNIRKERIERGWTQEYIAKQVGLSKQQIQQIETGRRKPSYDVLIKLLTLFDIRTLPNEPVYKKIVWLFSVADEINLS